MPQPDKTPPFDADDRVVPGYPATACATPADVALIAMLGGQSFNGCSFTVDTMRRLRAAYGVDTSREHVADHQAMRETQVDKVYAKMLEEHAAANAPHAMWSPLRGKPTPERPKVDHAGEARFSGAGDDRNLFRRVQRDGLRLMAVLSRYMERGEDPVKLLVKLLVNNGCDVDPTACQWADSEDTTGEGPE